MPDFYFQPTLRDQERLERARAAVARESGIPVTEMDVNWTINSSSSLLISLAPRSERSYVVKLSKETINFSEHLYCPIWRSWNEFVWMHSAYLGGYRNTLQPVYGSAHDGFVILPELPPDRFHDLRSLLIGGTAKAEIVFQIFHAFIEIRENLQNAWREEMPFRTPEVVFFKFRIVPHFLAIMFKYHSNRIFYAIRNVVNYILTGRQIVIHGDFSPKNIMVGDDNHYLIDAEAAGIGNEDFDPFFFLSQLLIECTGCGDRRLWSEVAQEVVAMHFSRDAPDVHRTAICSSMLATMMLARLEGLARPREYSKLKKSSAFIDRIKSNIVSPVDPFAFIREMSGL